MTCARVYLHRTYYTYNTVIYSIMFTDFHNYRNLTVLPSEKKTNKKLIKVQYRIRRAIHNNIISRNNRTASYVYAFTVICVLCEFTWVSSPGFGRVWLRTVHV